MKLTYRGTTYDRHPSQADNRPFQQVREPGAAYNLSYRGVTYRLDPNAQPVESARPVTYQAIYRGITYFVRKTARGEVLAFLHADSVLPVGWDTAIYKSLQDDSVCGGAFRLKIDSSRKSLKLITIPIC